ncbi:MAG: SDR family NAD(P)-dependent oxidoreductase [Rhizobiales bacterium]|nr:SDR family NAD(P)-dependent oxidoreductase [Hyphomicrobiales bacterium]
MSRLAERTVVISGATSGIGKATARLLLDAGARVAVCGRSLAKAEDICRDRQGRAALLDLDVADPESVASLTRRLPAGWPVVDTVIAAAGHDVGGRQPFHECDAEALAGIVETNVNGTIRFVRAFIDGLRASGNGHIVTIGSIVGLRPYAGGSGYVPSKYAVRAFTEELRLDYRTEDLRVTEILPGLVETGFAAARHHGDEAVAAEFYSKAPGRLAPEDVAETILYALAAPPHVNISQLVVMPTRNK